MLCPARNRSEPCSRCAHIGRTRDGGDDGYAVGSSRHHGGRGIGRNAADTDHRNCDACGAQFRNPAGPAQHGPAERVGYMGPTPIVCARLHRMAGFRAEWADTPSIRSPMRARTSAAPASSWPTCTPSASTVTASSTSSFTMNGIRCWLHTREAAAQALRGLRLSVRQFLRGTGTA